MSEGQSLYERLGGEAAANELLEEFYQRILAHEELAPFFEHVDMARQRNMMHEFIFAALGGPATYTGRSISEAHQGRGIKIRHVQQFVDVLLDCLKDSGLEGRDVDQVIDRINTYTDEVLGDSTVDG